MIPDDMDDIEQFLYDETKNKTKYIIAKKLKWRVRDILDQMNINERITYPRVCLKNHSCNLHAPLCGIFYLHSVDVARYAALIQAKSPTNCGIQLTESIFQTHSSLDGMTKWLERYYYVREKC